jgi:hypothetical protein
VRAKGWRRRRLRQIVLIGMALVVADGWLRASEAQRERQTRRRLSGAA